MIKFSVLISVYDKVNPKYFELAIKSVFSQTLIPNEVVLVKDGKLNEELDNVIEIYEQLFNLKVIQLLKNEGLGKALNIGLENCSFEIVFRMDGDDICFPQRFEKQMHYLIENPDIAILGSELEEFEITPGDINRYRNVPITNDKIRKIAKFRNPLNHPTVVFKKSIVLEVGSYSEMPLFEDYFLWVRVLLKGYKIENLAMPLLYFRVDKNMIGRRHGFSYLVKELNFYWELKKIGFINWSFWFFVIIIRTPLRLIPKRLLSIFYTSFLRRKKKI